MSSGTKAAGFRVLQIDHVEVFVPDRRKAAAWYQDLLGLEVIPEFEHWAEDPRGPLMISSDAGDTKIALFTGPPESEGRSVGWRLTAFRVDGASFREFVDHARRKGLTDSTEAQFSKASIRDHSKAFSVYFSDPWGNPLEVTTYDHEQVRSWLEIR